MSALVDASGPNGAAPAGELRFPPVTEVGMTSLALIIIGGIYLAAHLPQAVPLAPAVVLLVLSITLLVANLVMLSRVSHFAWDRFFEIGRWALLAYAITAGMIEYAFIYDGISGGPLVVFTLSIIVYAVHVPMLIAFTVARYHDPDAVPFPTGPPPSA